MKTKLLIALGILAFALIGCQSPSATKGEGSTASSNTSGSSASTTSGDTSNPQPAAIADDLKTDAYHWYGLGNDKPVKLKVSAGEKSFDGAQTVKFMSSKDGQAIYEVNRDGSLGGILGTDTVTLKKDGVYITASTKFKDSAPNLDLPASLAPGTVWHNDGKLEMIDGRHFEQHLTLKVVGEQKVKTKAGEQTALLITSNGIVSIDGAKSRMESSLWYVKDKGLVKSVVTMKDIANKKAAPQVMTIEETP